MPLMPGSPRPSSPAAEVDSGVYRSIFQQPVLDIPSAAPSYAWFEFLLHPEALQKHLETLRRQQAVDVHSATSAMELVREFLDQAQLVADEGHGRNNRYRALLLVAAQVALQMELPLRTIEQELPLHFQRLLVDGIVDFAEQPPAQRSEFARDVTLRSLEARVLHQRWTLRALVSQSQNGYLTCSNSSDGEDIGVSYQVALGDLMPSHLQIAQSIQATLAEDDERRALPPQTQLDAFYDLGVYFFSFSGYERAYSCFSRAAELLEDHSEGSMTDRVDEQQTVALSKEERDSLEGYLKACEAVLEAKPPTDAVASAQMPKARMELAWESRDWEKVIELLQDDMVAPELARLAPGYRVALEQQALRLMRSNCDSTPDASDEDGQLSAPVVRLLYKRLAIANAIRFHLLTDEDATSDLLDLESCVCSIARLLQGEIFHSATRTSGDAHVFPELARFVLTLTAHLLEHLSSGDPANARLKQFVARLMEIVPAIASVSGVSKPLAQCGYSSRGMAGDVPAAAEPQALEQLLATERDIRADTKQQCDHFRVMADLSRLYEFENAKKKAALLASVREQVSSLVASGQSRPGHDEDTCAWRSFITFCLLHNCWDLLEKSKALWKDSAKAQSELDFALACGAMVRFLSALSASPLPGIRGGDGDNAGQAPGKVEFSIAASNKIVAEILLKRRHVAFDASAAGSSQSDVKHEEWANDMVDLPVWVVETLVCISAGLLHRAHMRNVCEYRISFDLTPYGDLAFLQAFAPESAKADGVKSEPGGDPALSSSQFLRSHQSDLVALLLTGLESLVGRCGREPRWHCARADLALNPIVRQKLSATSDPLTALKGYLVAASLATNFFADMVSVVDIIDQTSLVRLSQCLVKVGAHTAAAVLYQCFPPEEFKFGLRILRLSPESHDDVFFQYFWELPFLELLVHLHSKPKIFNSSHVTLLTHLIQSPELNSSNPPPVVKDAEQRILRCYFRDLCRLYLGAC